MLEIAVPRVGADEDLARALLQEWPSYIGFLLSFATIGIMWVNHDAMVKDLTHVDRPLMLLNVLLLLFISFVPFPTAVLAEHFKSQEHRLTATVFYGATFTAIAIVWNASWFYIVRKRLVDPRVSDARIAARTRIYRASPFIYGAGIPLAFVSPWVSLAFYGALDLLYTLPQPE